MPPYRILLAEDHTLFREMIKKSLGEIPGLEVVGEVGDGLELLESLKTLTPDLLILDIGMPNLSGLEAAKRIKPTHPGIKILLLTMYKTRDHLKHALEAGVDGYLLKENTFKELITAIETIRQGNSYISKTISQKMVNFFFHKTCPSPKASEILSTREKEVLEHFVQGKSPQEIAELLFISHPTVRNHLANIKRKLSLRRNIDLVKYAIKAGYISID